MQDEARAALATVVQALNAGAITLFEVQLAIEVSPDDGEPQRPGMEIYRRYHFESLSLEKKFEIIVRDTTARLMRAAAGQANTQGE